MKGLNEMEQTRNAANLEYPSYIHESRRPQRAPSAIVTDGKSVFGAFDGPIKNLNIVDAKKPVSAALPHFANSLRIREWEAYEVCFDEGFICGAIYDMGIAVFNIMMFYDRDAKKVLTSQIFGPPRKCVQNSLFNSTNRLKTGSFEASINNQMQAGKVFIKTDYSPRSAKKVPMAADLVFSSCAVPSITVMPLGENRPLYTQKEFFKAEGTIKIGNREFFMNENSVGIIDDHKGYYSMHMHYDWLTGMGVLNGSPLGFNLCKNQAECPEKHSENLLWLNGECHLLPPVDFEHLSDGNWRVFDKYGAVDILFEIDDAYNLTKGFGPVSTKYIAPFGNIKGFAKDLSGNKIVLDGLTGMGEDITVIRM